VSHRTTRSEELPVHKDPEEKIQVLRRVKEEEERLLLSGSIVEQTKEESSFQNGPK